MELKNGLVVARNRDTEGKGRVDVSIKGEHEGDTYKKIS